MNQKLLCLVTLATVTAFQGEAQGSDKERLEVNGKQMAQMYGAGHPAIGYYESNDGQTARLKIQLASSLDAYLEPSYSVKTLLSSLAVIVDSPQKIEGFLVFKLYESRKASVKTLSVIDGEVEYFRIFSGAPEISVPLKYILERKVFGELPHQYKLE